MTTKRFVTVVASLVRKETGLSLQDVDADFDCQQWHDKGATDSEQVDAAVQAADAVLCLNGYRDDNPAMTASLVATVMDDLIS